MNENNGAHEINKGYIKFIENISSLLLERSQNSKKRFITTGKIYVKVFFIPLLFLYGLIATAFLKLRLMFIGTHDLPELYKKATEYIPEFIPQYPMHVYPVVAKSLELAFIKGNIGTITDTIDNGAVELAIGDGTLSRRIFKDIKKDIKITAFDLNPYSLVHTAGDGHISERIIADCLTPPIKDHGASFIFCMNLLHHVSQKEHVIKNWARIAPYALFNENTDYWASGWSKPYLLRLAGLKSLSQRSAQKIEKDSLQSLWSYKRLNSLIANYYEPLEQITFFSEKAFFVCSICSALLFCYGPPTPDFQKKIMKRLFWPITRFITYHLAKAIMEYDALLPRSRDTFVFWLVQSKLAEKKDSVHEVILVCPDCRQPLQENKCRNCKKEFERKNGMIFLLPKELEEKIAYSATIKDVLGKEHL